MFYDYLKDFEVKEGLFNFQSKEYCRKYLIKDENFWEIYDSVSTDKYLMEHSILPYSCLRIDVDIKLPQLTLRPQGRLYNKTHVLDLIKYINGILSDLYEDNDIHDEWFISVVFEKSNYKEKDGFHIIYPNMLVYNTYQDSLVVNYLRKVSFESPYEFTIDNVATKPWVLIGSKKDSSSFLYCVTGVYDKSVNEIENTFKTKDYSINKETSRLVLGQFEEEPVIIVKKRPLKHIDDDYEFIVKHKLLYYLSKDRIEDYDKWLDVGITLYNIGEGDKRFFNLWVSFSKASSKFSDDICLRKWRSFTIKGKTIRTLLWWVKHDNVNALENEVQEGINNIMYNLLFPEEEEDSDEVIKELLKRKLQHLDVAKIFKTKFNGVYTYYNDKNEKTGEWYNFSSGKWNLVPREILMREIETLKPHIIESCKDFLMDKAAINKIDTFFAKFKLNLSESFANQTFIEKSLKGCQTELFDDEYGKKVDKNKYLLGCNNGTLDFEKEIFRESNPDDYISMSTGITYREYSEKDKEHIELQKYLEEVFPDSDIKELALDIFASCLIGMNTHKIFVIAVGNHDAGKSATMSLLEKTFGEYSDKLDKSIILQKSSAIRSSDARPDLIITKGKRIIITQETGTEQVNIATLKELTGNDTLSFRGLYKQSNGPIATMFTLFLACNDLPRIPQNDEATWRRIVILEFQSKFTDGAPATREEQINTKTFPINRNIQERLTKLAPCFLWFLFKRCIEKKFHKNGSLNYTDSILQYKNERRNKNDPIFLFFTECVIKDSDEESFVSVSDAFKKFKEWFPTTFPSQKMIYSRESFKEYINRHLGKVIKRKRTEGWLSIRLVDDYL
jgi:P4 family phage/plasmid primase-like protien